MKTASQRVKEWRENNPDKLKEQRDKWNRSEGKKKAHSKWRKLHPEHDQEYYEMNKDKIKAKNKKYYQENKDRFKDNILNQLYGISLDEYMTLLEQQGGVCAICGQPETRTLKGDISALSVDHNHTTNTVRGLLCSRCNLAIGNFNDDVELLKASIAYLEAHHED